MFWTALVWGLGVSLGASVGLMSFVLMNAAFNAIIGSDAAKAVEDIHERSHQALLIRNELTERIITHLATLAEAAENTGTSTQDGND